MFQNAEPIVSLKKGIILKSRDQQLTRSTSDAALKNESTESLERGGGEYMRREKND